MSDKASSVVLLCRPEHLSQLRTDGDRFASSSRRCWPLGTQHRQVSTRKSWKGALSMNYPANSPCLSSKGSEIDNCPTNMQIKVDFAHLKLASPPCGPQGLMRTPEAKESNLGNFDTVTAPHANLESEPCRFIPSPFRYPCSRVFIVQGISLEPLTPI